MRYSTFADRIWNQIERQHPQDCWPWTGRVNSRGYGQSYRWDVVLKRMHTVGAHRAAYELTHGPIPKGLHVCHRCDNPPCCNPAHLFVGTAQDNVQDCIRKGRRSKERAPYNCGERNSHAKITEAVAREILDKVADGHEQLQIARDLGVDKGTIWRLVHGHTWKHLHR